MIFPAVYNKICMQQNMHIKIFPHINILPFAVFLLPIYNIKMGFHWITFRNNFFANLYKKHILFYSREMIPETDWGVGTSNILFSKKIRTAGEINELCTDFFLTTSNSKQVFNLQLCCLPSHKMNWIWLTLQPRIISPEKHSSLKTHYIYIYNIYILKKKE